MKKFLLKCLLLIMVVSGVIVSVNRAVDPANLFHSNTLVEKMAEALSEGYIINTHGDYNEGLLIEKRVALFSKRPETVVIGSSHVRYADWSQIYNDVYIAPVSGACLGDIYSVVGLLDQYDVLPNRIVIGLDCHVMKQGLWAWHSDFEEYGIFEKNKIAGDADILQEIDAVSEDEGKIDLEKIAELFSFPYFQASVTMLRGKGVHYCLSDERETIIVYSDAEQNEEGKLLPNGRAIPYAGKYRSVEQMEYEAQNAIEMNDFPVIGDELTTLSVQNCADLESLLEYLLDEGIEVIVYLPATYPTIYDYWTNSDKFRGVEETEAYVRGICAKNYISVCGSYDPHYAGFTRENFMDCYHLKPEKTLEDFQLILG